MRANNPVLHKLQLRLIGSVVASSGTGFSVLDHTGDAMRTCAQGKIEPRRSRSRGEFDPQSRARDQVVQVLRFSGSRHCLEPG